MKPAVTIVKVGGKIIESPESLRILCDQFATIGGMKLLVHGGGRSASQLARRLGIEPQLIDGRRVTDAPMLEIALMVYAGVVNKTLVAQLQARGQNAVGLTGADLDLIRSRRRPIRDGVDFGYVGDVERVDAQRVARLLADGAVPVLAPLTHDGRGQMLNTNADTIAATTAKALAASFDVQLVFCFEHNGVLRHPDDEQSVIAHLTPESFSQLRDAGIVSGGMLPKIENCLDAVSHGVASVRITRADNLSRPDSGTRITR